MIEAKAFRNLCSSHLFMPLHFPPYLDLFSFTPSKQKIVGGGVLRWERTVWNLPSPWVPQTGDSSCLRALRPAV